MGRFKIKAYIKISIGYLLIAGTWIIISDSVLSLIVNNPEVLTNLQTYKGWFFVIVTTILLFGMLKRWMNNLEKSYELEKQTRIELEQTEVQLRKKEELNRILIEQAADGIFVTDENGILIEVNKSACDITSVKPDELLGNNLSNFFTRDDNSILTSVKGTDKTGEWKGEKIISTNSTLTYVELNTARLSDNRFMILSRDITGKKKAEREIKEMNDRLTGIINASPAAIILLEPDGIVGAIWNEAAENIFLWKKEEVIGKPLPIIPDEYKDEFLGFLNNIKSGKDISGVEVIRKRKDDTKAFLHLSAAPIFDVNGNVINIVGVMNDISEKVKVREELEASEKKLRLLAQHLQRLQEEERAAIARELHDELGQILTSLKISLNFMSQDILQYKEKFDEQSFKNEISSMNEMIDQTTKRLRKLISELRTDILDNLGLLSAIDYEVKQFNENSGISCNFSSDDISNILNKNKAYTILRVLQESFNNIKKYSTAKNVEATLLKTNGNLTLTVKDDGVGFNEEEIKNKETFGILGMKERAQAVDGNLIVKSSPGYGTNVILNIPDEN